MEWVREIDGLEEKVDYGFKKLASEIRKVNAKVDNLEIEGKDAGELIKPIQQEI